MRRLLLSFVIASFLFNTVQIIEAQETATENNLDVKESESIIKISNHNSCLEVFKNGGILKLINQEGTPVFKLARSFEFLYGDKWVDVDKVNVSQSKSGSELILNFILENSQKMSMEVLAYGNKGFRIKTKDEKNDFSAIRGSVELNDPEEIYGFGEMWNGHVAQRGQEITIWDKTGTPDECAYMPYYVSTNNYALFLNYGGLVNFDVGKDNPGLLSFQYGYNILDLSMVTGMDIKEVVNNFFARVSRPLVPPEWTFKPWFWLMSDPDKPEGDISTLRGKHALTMARRLISMNIPIGVTWLEPPWQTARTSFIQNPEFVDDLTGLIDELEKLDVRTLAWTVPYTTDESPNWDEAIENGYLTEKAGSIGPDGKITITESGEVSGSQYNYIDFYDPEAFEWWQRQIGIALDYGFDGFKIDAGQNLEKDAVLYGGRLGKDVHNSYALEYNRVFAETLKERLSGDFLLIPRAAFIGSSSQLSFKWPGDLSCSFAENGLKSSVYSSLSLAFCGIPLLNTDIGGFQDRPAPEDVWVRWAQFGAFLPGMQTLNMPWWYSDKAIDHFRFLSWLHTDLTPYWMSLAEESHKTSAPVCRPLVWEYQEDRNTWNIDDEFTVGKYLLVAPLLDASTEREVYLPEGNWYNFPDDSEVFSGKRTIAWKADESEGIYDFPLFVKEGAVLPFNIANQFSGLGFEEFKDYLCLGIWPEKNNKNTDIIYSRAKEARVIVSNPSSHIFSINVSGVNDSLIYRINNPLSEEPGKITFNEKKLDKIRGSMLEFRKSTGSGWHYDEVSRKIWIRINEEEKENILTITFNP